MNAKALTTAVITFSIAVVLFSSVLVPIIGDASTTTTSVDNEGAVGLRMDKITSGDFTLNYGLVGDDFTATNGTDTQIIDDMCIFYADDNLAVWMDDSSVRMLGKDANNQTIDAVLSDEATITITKSADGVSVTDGTVDQTFPVPAWSYVPKSTGAYGFFLNETEVNTGGLDVHYVGSYAGVNCYDSINTYDLPITLDATLTGSELSGAKWIKQATETTPEELNPDDLHIIPLNPSVIDIDPEPDVSIMSVPTPTYTDGDWGYDIVTVDGVQKAKIVSYSGAGGGAITIPATVGGYTVDSVGKGGSNQNVFDTGITATDLIFSDGIKTINKYALKNCSGFTGTLTIPDSVTTISDFAFIGCSGFTGTLTIPANITTVYGNSFENCSGFTKLILPDNLITIYGGAFMGCSGLDGTIILPADITIIGGGCFSGCTNLDSLIILCSALPSYDTAFYNTGIKEVLNLSSNTWTTTSYGLTADEVRLDVPALGYLAPAQYKETVQNDGPASVLLNVIPLLVIIGLLIATVTMFIKKQ